MTVNRGTAAGRCRCPGAGLGRGFCPGLRWGWARHSRPPIARGLSCTEVRQVPEYPRPAPRTDAGRAARWHSALPLLKVTHSAIAHGSHAQQDRAEPVFPLADGAAGVRPNGGAELVLSCAPHIPRVWKLVLGGGGQAGPWKGCLVSAWVPDPLDLRSESGWGFREWFGTGKRLVTQLRPVKCVGQAPNPHRRRPQKVLLFGHCPGCSLSPRPAVPLGVSAPLCCSGCSQPATPCFRPPASPWHPAGSRLRGSFLGVPRGSPPWEPGQPASSQAP